MRTLTLTWHGHSCFSAEADSFHVVFDPYSPDSVPGLKPLSLTADLVLSSHEHRDHQCPEAVSLSGKEADCPFQIETIDSFHDDAGGSLRGTNRIHILTAGGLRLAHMGDIGCTLESAQLERLKDLDVLLLPVGGYYTIDASQAKALEGILRPRVTIPMHYRTANFGYPVISTLDAYTQLCDDVVIYDTNVLTIDKQTKPQTAILTLS
ncbi:MAG: MBL fold metallo-hydrolase [Lachnospiraceae bacterium]|jgi:L-ascorbate metabolism protein UlaG (beta-lactamase superfamily)|nr:MBL fold metallo-hydrolase [Lachnospiraceae bacterium]